MLLSRAATKGKKGWRKLMFIAGIKDHLRDEVPLRLSPSVNHVAKRVLPDRSMMHTALSSILAAVIASSNPDLAIADRLPTISLADTPTPAYLQKGEGLVPPPLAALKSPTYGMYERMQPRPPTFQDKAEKFAESLIPLVKAARAKDVTEDLVCKILAFTQCLIPPFSMFDLGKAQSI